jgi:hypothetical protein
MKKCYKCQIEQDLNCFSKDKATKHGYSSRCKKCSKELYALWRKENHEAIKKKDRITHYVRSYNLTEEQVSALVENRNGVCKVCSLFLPLVVDHCHTTGKVRGLICSSCNSVLGYAKDNKKTLENAIKYLEDFYEKNRLAG